VDVGQKSYLADLVLVRKIPRRFLLCHRTKQTISGHPEEGQNETPHEFSGTRVRLHGIWPAHQFGSGGGVEDLD
jgi:hypothetical protein